jgi:cupin
MDQHLALPALRALPQAVSLRVGMEPGCSPLSDTLRMLRNEVETPNFGNQIVVRNLLSSLFVYFMRDWPTLLFSQQKTGFLLYVRRTPRGLSRACTRHPNVRGRYRISPE